MEECEHPACAEEFDGSEGEIFCSEVCRLWAEEVDQSYV